ncbi:HXXEE domain-containing protein [Bacillus sp. MSP13]|uniref:HXXEE domain-containing protein n=1 Tax=Bacillus sp. MSP13 TaxID=1071061 RepID=UPI0009E5F7C7
MNRFEGISSESFSIGVFEEFIIICIFTVVCIQFNFYNLFFSLVLVYFLHILIHILQCIYIKKYVPGTLSGVISSVHNVYIFYEFYEHQLVNWKYIVPYILILFILNIHFCLHIGKKVYAVISGKILIKSFFV